MLTIFLALAIAATAELFDRTQRGSSPQGDVENIVVTRIMSGDVEAIRLVEADGNRLYIPVLKRLISSPPAVMDSMFVVETAHHALAKLGDHDELQSRWCAAIAEVPSLSQERFQRLDVGGWFAVQAYGKLLAPHGLDPWYRSVRRYLVKHPSEGDNDAPNRQPQFHILENLEKSVPNPPTRLGRLTGDDVAEYDSQARIWLNWIPEHAVELSELRPRGQDIDFSTKACNKNGSLRLKH